MMMKTSQCFARVTGFPAEGDARKRQSWEEQKKGFSVSVTAAVRCFKTVVRTLTNSAPQLGR